MDSAAARIIAGEFIGKPPMTSPRKIGSFMAKDQRAAASRRGRRAVKFLAAAGLPAAVALLAMRRSSSGNGSSAKTYTLPNGMEIRHQNRAETTFLFDEIWGADSAYGRAESIEFKPGSVIVDAGANIGLFALYAANRCEGAATIYAFEPIAPIFDVLAANAASANSGCYENLNRKDSTGNLDIKTFNVGLGSENSELVFQYHPHFTIWSTSDGEFAADRVERITRDIKQATKNSPSALMRFIALTVPSPIVVLICRLLLHRLGKTVEMKARLTTLASVIEDQNIDRIDILKVDVEGAELAVLEGVGDENWPKVQQAVLEVESFAKRDHVEAFLRTKGFHTHSFASERERTPGVLSEVSMVYARRASPLGAGPDGQL